MCLRHLWFSTEEVVSPVLFSDSEYFVSSAQRGRANPVGPCSDLWHQYWVAVEYHAAAILVKKAKATRANGLCGPGTILSGRVRGNEIADKL